MTLELTVAIPVYNGAKRLPLVLESLRDQRGTEAIAWEILVVDNNSTDNTAEVVHHYQAHWSRPWPLRYCLERSQGAAYARSRAIRDSTAPLVGFLDDDTIPSAHWVAAACEFARHYPQAGAWGSQVHGDYEVEPSPELANILPFLAITERGSSPLRYDPKKRLLPPSAGLAVRRQVWLDCVPNQPILSGRVAGRMLTGEDLESLSYIRQSGWEIWYNPAMELTHKIPAWRLQKDYLIPFIRGIGLSRYITRTLGVRPVFKPFVASAYALNDLRRIVWHLCRYRTSLRHHLGALCELNLYASSLLSPLYWWQRSRLQEHSDA